MKVYRLIVFILVFVLALSACNLPSARATEQVNPNAVFTAAAETVVVELTKNALLNPTNPAATLAAPTDVPPPAVTEAPTLPASGPTQTTGPLLPQILRSLLRQQRPVILPSLWRMLPSRMEHHLMPVPALPRPGA